MMTEPDEALLATPESGSDCSTVMTSLTGVSQLLSPRQQRRQQRRGEGRVECLKEKAMACLHTDYLRWAHHHQCVLPLLMYNLMTACGDDEGGYEAGFCADKESSSNAEDDGDDARSFFRKHHDHVAYIVIQHYPRDAIKFQVVRTGIVRLHEEADLIAHRAFLHDPLGFVRLPYTVYMSSMLPADGIIVSDVRTEVFTYPEEMFNQPPADLYYNSVDDVLQVINSGEELRVMTEARKIVLRAKKAGRCLS